MKKKVVDWLLLSLVLLLPGIASAQSDEHKWALQYTGGVWVRPILTSNPSHISQGKSEAFSLAGEIYMPKKWNLQAGYFRTDLHYGDATRTMEGLQLGVKKYFLSREFFVQPYLSGATQLNWGRHTEYTDFTYGSYFRKQQTVNPRISFVPGVGFDLYVLSSIAFVMEYNVNLGVSSHTQVSYTSDNGNGNPIQLQDKGLFQNLSLGVKVAFPFTLTSQDGWSLFSLLFDTTMDAIDRAIGGDY